MDNDNSTMLDIYNGGNKPSKKRKIIVAVLVAAVVLAALAAIWLTRGGDVDMTDSRVLMTKEYELNSNTDFYINDDNIFYASKNGISLLNEKGETKWTDSFSMTRPAITGNGNVCAVAETDGSIIRVYNETGLVYDVTFGSSVVTYSINGSGYLIAITQSGDGYEMALYNGTGEKLRGGNYAADDGVPTSADISADGKMFAVSFMLTSGLSLQGRVLYYYTDTASANGTDTSDGMAASIECGDGLPFMLRFASNDNCVCLMDNKLVFMRPVDNSSSQKTELTVGNNISYACFNGDGTLAVAYGAQLLNAAESVEENTVVWYSSKGERVNEYKADKDITGLYAAKNATVIGMDRYFEAYKTKGGSLWQYTALQDTDKVLLYGSGNDKMLVVTPIKASLARAGRGNNIIETGGENTTQSETQTATEGASHATTPAEGATQAATENVTQETTADGETQTEAATESETESSAAQSETAAEAD